MKIFVKKHKGALHPIGTPSFESFMKIKDGEVRQFTFRPVRSYQQHKLFFSLIKMAFDNKPHKFDEVYPTPEILRKALLLQAGFYDIIVGFDGTINYQAASMSYESMPKDEFEAVFNGVAEVIKEKLIHELDLHDIKATLEEFYG